ncbi:hypothetical protein UlMin_010112 [Ulmus minor]
MEELRQMGLTYHSAATQEIKDMVEEFYKEMDPKDNGYVKFKEFSAYMETIGCQHLSSDEFFDLLKQPGHEELYIEDVITLFYIINSQRPFCGGKCRKFVTGVYFTCVKCFDGSASTFSVCPQCFDGEQYKHEHKEFLDPMVILHLKRELAINQKSSTSRDDEDEEEPIGSSTTTTSTSTSKRIATSRERAAIDGATRHDDCSILSQGEVDMPRNFRVRSDSSYWGNQDEENNYPWFETRISRVRATSRCLPCPRNEEKFAICGSIDIIRPLCLVWSPRREGVS